MSTVVYKNGVMASDSRSHSGTPHPIGMRDKIWRHPSGGLFGICAGTHGDSSQFKNLIMEYHTLNFLDLHMLPSHFGGQILAVSKEGRVFYLSNGMGFVGPLRADFFAIGTGAAYAYGALAAGASPEEAVEIAISADVYSGGEIRRLDLENE